MTKHTHHRDYLICAVAAFLLLLPPLLFLAVGNDFAFSARAFVQSLAFICVLFIALGKARWILWATLPIALIIPGECYFVLKYGYPSSRHMISLLTESSAQETLEFLSGIWHWLALSLATVIGTVLALLRFASSEPLFSQKWWVAAANCILFFGIGFEFVRTSTWAPEGIRTYSLANSFPLGVAYRVGGYLKYTKEARQVVAQLRSFQFGAQSTAEDQTVVLVIGESARPDHWALNGYHRDTNPNLSKERNLVSFPDVVTPWALTTYSTPILITRKGATSTEIFPEESIVAAAAEAGFQTSWFANQDGLKELAVHREEAATRKVFNMAVEREDVDAAYDGQMLPDISAAIGDGRGRRLLVVHMKGSHWDYHLRYPKDFAHFIPDRSDSGGATKHDPQQRDRLINSYDNSIRYADKFLSDIANTLRSTGRPAALLYVSDHGQALYDNGCSMFGHYNDTEINFRTEAFIWLSNAQINRRPEIMASLRDNRGKAIGTQGTMFNTLADLLELNITDKSVSLLSNGFRLRERPVNTSQGTVDFDRAKRSGACALLLKE